MKSAANSPRPIRTHAVPAFLMGIAAITLSSAYLFSDEPGQDDLPADMGVVRERFVAEILGSAPGEGTARNLMENLRADGSWPGIDYDDVSRTGFEHRVHLENLRTLSRAFRHPESALTENSDLEDAVLSALGFWLEHDFIAENWWWNEMGTPDRLIDTLLLMDESMSDAQRTDGARIAARANLEGFGARPGGDLIQIAGIMGKRALFERDADAFERAVDAMANEVRITTGRGLQPDLSLQHRHDRVTSTLTYGRGYAASFARYAGKLRGTRFQFPDDTINLLIDFYLDGIHRSMAHGRYPDPPQLNRGITRRSALRPEGPGIPEALAEVSMYRREELKTLAAVRRGETVPDFRFNKYFWSSEYHTHQRPEFFASVRLYSKRNHSVEEPYNEEGLRNHHLADGANFIVRTGREYRDVFPVYDWQKIPGSTVVQKPSLPSPNQIQQRGVTEFVGGLTDGRYGLTAFDFASPLDDLTAKKAWFFFDREFVALGAGITSGSKHPVATTLNQSRLDGPVYAESEDEVLSLEHGAHTLADTRWVWHDGTAYVFPKAAPVRLRNETATGSWREINRQSWATDDLVEDEVFTLWLDHGPSPRQADYAYFVIPGIDPSEISAYLNASEVSIIANTEAIQGVTHEAAGLAQLVFHEAGKINVRPGLAIEMDQPGLIMLAWSDERLTRITVADPARRHSRLFVRINVPFEGEGEGWSTTWNPEAAVTEIVVEMPDDEYAGKSRSLEGTSPVTHENPSRPNRY